MIRRFPKIHLGNFPPQASNTIRRKMQTTLQKLVFFGQKNCYINRYRSQKANKHLRRYANVCFKIRRQIQWFVTSGRT
jgi:hypothetical protein